MGVTWTNGNLSARPLFRALRWNGIDPTEHRFENLFIDGDGPPQLRLDAAALLASADCEIIALGNKVSRELDMLGCKHTKIAHPAALGKIRETRTYIAHVGEKLGLKPPIFVDTGAEAC
jgi:hypothetical protein